MKDGRLQQVGTPRELYETPVNQFVAGFIGSPAMNLLPATVSGGGVSLGGVEFALPAAASQAPGSAVVLGVRPEDLVVASGEEPGIETVIDLVEELGADGYLYGHIAQEGERRDVVARVDGRAHPAAGETVRLVPDRSHLHLFSAETGERLG